MDPSCAVCIICPSLWSHGSALSYWMEGAGFEKKKERSIIFGSMYLLPVSISSFCKDAGVSKIHVL